MIPIIPVNLPKDSKPANTFSLAKYGGKINENFERMFNSQQKSGDFGYDSNYIDKNTFIKNIKYSAVEVTERVYVDKPLKKLKEVPI